MWTLQCQDQRIRFVTDAGTFAHAQIGHTAGRKASASIPMSHHGCPLATHASEDIRKRIQGTLWYQMNAFGVRFIFQMDPAMIGQTKAARKLNHTIQSIELIVVPQPGFQAH